MEAGRVVRREVDPASDELPTRGGGRGALNPGKGRGRVNGAGKGRGQGTIAAPGPLPMDEEREPAPKDDAEDTRRVQVLRAHRENKGGGIQNVK